MRTLRQRLDDCGGTLDGMFEAFLPGRSTAIIALRQAALALCRDPGAHGALIIGPPGSGKSTLARAIGFGRYLHGLKPEAVRRAIDDLKVEPPSRISRKSMNWYEELSLTGLVESLADSQLFGCVEGAGTGVAKRKGVFYQASMGHQESGGRASAGATVTGGVVFLDEIGDLPASLQPKLLTVLTGAELSPVGAEGVEEQTYRFEGLTMAATWKDPRNELRHDLVSRLTDHVLPMPALEERLDDFDIIVDSIVSELAGSHQAWLERSKKLVDVDGERLADYVKKIRESDIASRDREVLRCTDWSRYADMRGLAQTIRRMLDQGLGAEEALSRQMQLAARRTGGEISDEALLGNLMKLAADGRATTLSGLVTECEQIARAKMFAGLKSKPPVLAELASHLGATVSQVRGWMADLERDRRGGRTRRGTRD